MTFKDLLEKLGHDYLNPSVMPDGKMNADKNGHTRLVDLQKKYNLSSLKVQKLLVTAGVYMPVKENSSYNTIKTLYELGKNPNEIMEITGLSRAVINASVPYENIPHNAEELGMSITDDAERKRKQRSNEVMKKENARDILMDSLTDDTLWSAISEHAEETFLTADGRRFIVDTRFAYEGKNGVENIGRYELAVSLVDIAGNTQETIMIPQQEAFNAFHRAIDEMAGESVSLGEYENFLRPLFIYLGILKGDRSAVCTKRSVPEEKRCFCCGRKTDSLYSVSSFEDLLELNRCFDDERKAAWSENEKENAKVVDFIMASEQEYWKKKKREQFAAARKSKAVEAFDEEGERMLCKLCCLTICDALLEGVLPATKRIDGYDDVDDEDLLSVILDSCATAKADYYQVNEGVFKGSEFDNHSLFLYKVRDKHGIEHSFALTTQQISYDEGDLGLALTGKEVHKLTKAGKIATDNTDTDFDVSHFKMCRKGEDLNHKMLVGLVELIEKINDVMKSETLSESHMPASNNITINEHYYGIESIGTIIPVFVEHAGNYRSMRSREWDGSEHGFLIDGILFTGDEVALMFSCQEGAQIKFYADDPSSQPLRSDEFLMQVRLNQSDLVDETIGLINMFTTDGRFEGIRDQESFCKMFKKYILEKYRLYNDSRPRGYGRLAGMEIIKKLKIIEGTEQCQEMIREIIRACI